MFRPIVVAPTYNNARTVAGIVCRVLALDVSIIIVNDGSNDGTEQILDELSALPDVFVLTHEANRGKAAALRTGFDVAIARGFSHAVTIDTDGQLRPEEIPHLLAEACRHPGALIIGARNDRTADYPSRSQFGRRFSNLAVRLETGACVADTQCGLRVYPLNLTRLVRTRFTRFAYETEIITRALWSNREVRSVPVSCRYFTGEDRVTHFRPLVDSVHAVLMHGTLLFRSLLFRAPQMDGERARLPWWRRLGAWLSPRTLWNQLRAEGVERQTIAAGVAVGVFIANLPIYGLQTITSLFVAKRLHMHPIAVVLGSHISTPPIGPLLIIAAIYTGFIVTAGRLPTPADFDPTAIEFSELFRRVLVEWTLGGCVLGLVLGAIAYLLVQLIGRSLGSDSEAEVVSVEFSDSTDRQ